MSSDARAAARNDAQESYGNYMAQIGAERIPCYEPSIGAEEIALLTDVINRNWLSESIYTRRFEEEIAKLCGRSTGLAFGTCTAAMIVGMRSLGIGPGDEVIVPTFSHPADPNSIAATGARPVFADVDATSLCLSDATIDAVVTPKTKAVLVVHSYGHAADLKGIVEYARQKGVLLINDCAQALGVTYDGRAVASYGSFAALSFFADKTITTGEGGMLVTDDADLVGECNIYKHDGRRERGIDLIERQGYNFRVTELQMAVGVAQLAKFAHFVQRKREILAAYKQRLETVEGVEFFLPLPQVEPVPHRVVIKVKDAQKLMDGLAAAGIGARQMFALMHEQPCYGDTGSYPVSEEAQRRGVCLPSAPSLTEDQIDYVCTTIARCMA